MQGEKKFAKYSKIIQNYENHLKVGQTMKSNGKVYETRERKHYIVVSSKQIIHF